MEKQGLVYNSQRGNMAIPEYGRNIQTMIRHILTIKDRDKRTQAAHFIVSVMAQMNPQVKESNDYMQKLWDHMYIISEYKLDIDSPYAMPKPEERSATPHKIGYQNNTIQCGHYGYYIEKVIEAICELEDEEKRQLFAVSIANLMKRNYLNWNRNTVNDAVILEDLKTLSKGRLCLPEDTKLMSTNEILGKVNVQQQQQPIAQKKKKKPQPMAKNNNNNNAKNKFNKKNK